MQDARVRGHMKINNLSVFGNESDFQILQNLYGFTDVGNYLPILEITF